MRFWAILGVVLLAGCHDGQLHSVEWYAAHPDERMAIATACRDLPPAKSAADQNCANARAAIRRADDAGGWVRLK